ncbi:hypothetical protein F5Y17DRAFT_101344 [Xylariaceae sp. FL0594]|nr:hypothetical protein F5Y17DRAFT_101344 [Xylariaceae sp. FL0594]
MAEPKKRGFWGSLFRSRQGSAKLEKEYSGRHSDGDLLSHAHRPERHRVVGTRRRARRPDPRDPKGKGREPANGLYAHGSERSTLTEWPPPGISIDGDFTLGQAMGNICRGVPTFNGHKRPITHAPDHYYGLYATAAGNHGDGNDGVNQHNAMTQLMTIRLQGSGPPTYPWETLEQPSCAFGIGARPGTITLNAWVSRSSLMPPIIALRDPGMPPRDASLSQIFERLKDFEAGLEDDDEESMYQGLYKTFLRDPDKTSNPRKRMEQQITDLVICLSGPDWIDFTSLKNQVVTKFIYDTGQANQAQYQRFFYQLLLSLELELRINSRIHTDWAKERLINQIPPKLQWNLALARRWREYVRIEGYGATADRVKLRFKLRKRQSKMLKRFAQMMKWPNLAETLEILRQRDAEASLLTVSSHAMAFFSGLVLPGPTFPFLIMNSLVDIDPDTATDHLALLTHLNPSCGFQYRNSHTYWTAASIVGKVLAPTCLQVAGWVGPARPSGDLGRSQIARVRSRRPPQRMTVEDVASMRERSDPLGPAAEVYPVSEYDLPIPDADDAVDTVRVQMLNLKPVADKPDVSGPGLYDASILFAIDGASWPLQLSYDVSFVHAWPCSDGPHPLFFDYVYTAVKVDTVVGIRDWAKAQWQLPNSRGGSAKDGSTAALKLPDAQDQQKPRDDDDAERVLVIEAFGVRDNEVLARAWCSHWGLNAVVADVRRTW